MATVNVNIKMDAEVKRNMEKACEATGISMRAAFTIFAKKVDREFQSDFGGK